MLYEAYISASAMVQHAEKESTAHGASPRLPIECFQHEVYEPRRHCARPLGEVHIDIGILHSKPH